MHINNMQYSKVHYRIEREIREIYQICVEENLFALELIVKHID